MVVIFSTIQRAFCVIDPLKLKSWKW